MAETTEAARPQPKQRPCRHVCAFFHNQDEEYRFLLPVIKEGFEKQDRAFHIVDEKERAGHLRRLEGAHINVAEAQRKGQLEVRAWEDAYLREKRFDQNAMLALIEEVLTAEKSKSFGLTRLVAHMEWALSEMPGVADVVEYEARLNYILPKYEDTVICTYDLGRFSARVVMDVLRTHPMVIIGGLLQENPFYVPPDEFLRELAERRAGEPR